MISLDKLVISSCAWPAPRFRAILYRRTHSKIQSNFEKGCESYFNRTKISCGFSQTKTKLSKCRKKIKSMPFLHLMTNLSKDKISPQTMNSLAEEMSVILGKDKKWINWVLDDNKQMSRVSEFFTFFVNRLIFAL